MQKKTNVKKSYRTHSKQCPRNYHTNNHTKHIENGAQNTNVGTSLPGRIEKSAQGTKVPNNNKEHIRNAAQATDVTYNQNTCKTLSKELT